MGDAGEYYSGHGGTDSKGCQVKKCSSAKAGEKYKTTTCPSCTSTVAESQRCVKQSCGSLPNGKYWSSSGTGNCAQGDCTGAPAGNYYNTNGGTSKTGCKWTACT